MLKKPNAKKKVEMNQNKKGAELNLPTGGTGIPVHDKWAHAPGREPIYLSSRAHQKLPVFQYGIQSDSFKNVLNEESLKYVIRDQYSKKDCCGNIIPRF